MIGSIVYVGLIIGSIISGYVFSKFSSKFVIVGSMLGFLLMVSTFIITTNFRAILISRVFAGIF